MTPIDRSPGSPSLSRFFALMAPIVLCAASLPAQTPSFVTFDAPDAGVGNLQGTVPTCISRGGVIAGYYLDVTSKSHGFFRQSNGLITEFDVPGLASPSVLGINSHGQIVGNGSRASSSGNTVHGWLRNPNGHFVLIDPPGTTFTSPAGINDAGEIAGTWVDAAGVLHGFLRAANGTYTTLDDPDGTQSITEGTQSFALNGNGAVVGNYDDTNTADVRAYVRDQFGNYTNFDAVAGGSLEVFPIAINLGGQITGSYYNSGPGTHSFLRDASGGVTDFDMPGATDTVPSGMNDSAVIVGEWFDGHTNRGFQRDASGTLTSFFAPGPNQGTYPAGINNNGKITGYYWDTANTAHGFLK